MALINWNDGFSVNIAEIDQQHQKIIAMINTLHDAMTLGKGQNVIGKIVDDLISYTETHFKTEEIYFAQFGYPDTDRHKIKHAGFVQKVSDFKDGFEKGKLSLSIEVMTFLSDWWRNHIKGTDKKYSQFFNEKGLR